MKVLAIKSSQVITIFVTLVLVSILFWFLNKTKTGKSMRAYSDNEDLALLSGIDPKRVVMITWIIAGILATIGGALYGLDKSFKPFTYFNNMLTNFCCSNCWGYWKSFWSIFRRLCHSFFRNIPNLCLQKILYVYFASKYGARKFSSAFINRL